MSGKQEKHWAFTDGGPTLRDNFAMAALQGLLSNESAMLGITVTSEQGKGNQLLASHCYALADAMMKARQS
jgi:hypothetical protein